jgi:hyperosmotically inducible protein
VTENQSLQETVMKLRVAILIALAGVLGTTPAILSAQTPEENLVRQVRHELAMLPYYTVFDQLVFSVEGNTVTLSGQVNRPTLRSDAENVVRRIEGVGEVVNTIEVLPLSPHDDRIRLAVLRAVYRQPALQKYALGANPSIHVIVRNGNVVLEGSVLSPADRSIAHIQANAVSGVFSVTNNIRVGDNPA